MDRSARDRIWRIRQMIHGEENMTIGESHLPGKKV
jgi:hypothetical protein